MADRRLLEDGSLRLQEDGGRRLLEQQSAIGVTAALVEADDTLGASIAIALPPVIATGGARRGRRQRLIRVEAEFHPPIDMSARLVEDDDVLVALLEVAPGRKVVRRKRAVAALLLH